MKAHDPNHGSDSRAHWRMDNSTHWRMRAEEMRTLIEETYEFDGEGNDAQNGGGL